MTLRDATFPLVSRRRLIGLAFGAVHSARRGTGTDVAGSRPYRPGDDVDAIDWAASAKLSSATGSDEFVVRERFTEEAPRVVVVCDRRPAMALYPAELPWLRKAEAMRHAAEMVAESAGRARGFVGYLDYATGTEPFWRPPRSSAEAAHITERHLSWPDFDAPEDNVARALAFLAEHRRSVPPGSFVFVISDFLAPPPAEAWTRANELRWDVVPVVVQDPVWERSFPPVGSVVVPVAVPGARRARPVRLTAREVDELRLRNEQRFERLAAEFRDAGIEPVVVSSHEREEVLQAFLAWADERQWRRGWAA